MEMIFIPQSLIFKKLVHYTFKRNSGYKSRIVSVPMRSLYRNYPMFSDAKK